MDRCWGNAVPSGRGGWSAVLCGAPFGNCFVVYCRGCTILFVDVQDTLSYVCGELGCLLILADSGTAYG